MSFLQKGSGASPDPNWRRRRSERRQTRGGRNAHTKFAGSIINFSFTRALGGHYYLNSAISRQLPQPILIWSRHGLLDQCAGTMPSLPRLLLCTVCSLSSSGWCMAALGYYIFYSFYRLRLPVAAGVAFKKIRNCAVRLRLLENSRRFRGSLRAERGQVLHFSSEAASTRKSASLNPRRETQTICSCNWLTAF